MLARDIVLKNTLPHTVPHTVNTVVFMHHVGGGGEATRQIYHEGHEECTKSEKGAWNAPKKNFVMAGHLTHGCPVQRNRLPVRHGRA